MPDECPPADLTQDEVTRLHPLTNVAVLKRLLGALADIEDPLVRETLLRIAERGPDVEAPDSVSPPRRRSATPSRRIRFQPGEYVDYVFSTDDDELKRLLGQLFGRDAT
jgi:hypothetical protein